MQPGVAVRPYLWYAIAAATVIAVPAASLAVSGALAGDGSRRATSAEPRASAPSAPFATPAPSVNGGRGPYTFYFTRGMYTGGRRGWGGGAWATDYPKADRQFLVVLRRLTNLDASPSENAVALDDPELRRFPFLYMLEVGYMSLTPSQAQGLRDYMLAGGFVFIDDFWGTYQWQNFEAEMQRVLPEYPIVEMSLEHPLFRSFYEIRELLQVPAIDNWRYRGQTSEQDGVVPHVRGIFDERGRLMMLINWNTDIGDAWEWAEQPDYPLKFSTFAYQMGVNAIVYAMSH